MARKPPPVVPAEVLGAAAVALEAGDPEAALAHLLAAWRELRIARLADLIDRVAAGIVREPIRGRTIAERSKAWLAIAREKHAADVGRLLGAAWPGTWMEAQRWMRALLAFPHDPRIAREIAHQLDAQRYQSPAAFRYYHPLFTALDTLGDVRVAPILEGAVARRPPPTTGQYAETAVATRLRALPVPALDAATSAALERVEAWFAAEVSAERRRASGEADFLAAIHAAPDDLGVRQVFADWLLERGDPRGELIALQIAERDPRRQAVLLKEHGARWAGALHRVLAPDGRSWQAGFLAGGRLALGLAADHLHAALTDPSCATLRDLEAPGRGSWDPKVDALVRLPWARRLRTLRGLHETTALAVLTGEPRPALRELGFSPLPDGDRVARAQLATGDAVPGIEHLLIDTLGLLRPDPALFEWIFAAPLVRRLRRLTWKARPGELGHWLAVTRALEVPELALESIGYGPTYSVWQLVTTRVEGGVRIAGSPIGPSSLPSARELVDALRSVPSAQVRELAIAHADVVGYGDGELRELEATFAALPGAQIDVPWPRPRTDEGALELHVAGRQLAGAFPAVWDLVTAPPLALQIDHCLVDGRVADPAQVTRRRPRTRVRGSGPTGSVELQLQTDDVRIRATIDPEAIVATLPKLFALVPLHRGEAGFRTRPATLRLIAPHRTRLGWISVLSPHELVWLRARTLGQLADELPWLRVVSGHAQHALIAGTPDQPPAPDELAQLQAAVTARVGAALRAHCGYDLHELGFDVLRAPFAAAGFADVPSDDPYALAFARTGQRVHVELRFGVGTELTLVPRMHAGGRHQSLGGSFPAESTEAARRTLATIVARLPEVEGWLAG